MHGRTCRSMGRFINSLGKSDSSTPFFIGMFEILLFWFFGATCQIRTCYKSLAMAKTIPEYVKYTTEELDNYTNASDSCVKKVSAILHINIPPFGLNEFKKSLLRFLSTTKIGSYDQNLKAIILDIHNIKVLPDSGAIRFDDPNVHVNISCNCYIFQPVIGSIVRGTVRHVSSAQIGVNIYRVFSVSIRLLNKKQSSIEVDSEIDFKIKKYSLESAFPYIEGELVEKNPAEGKRKKIKREIEEQELDNSENIVKLIEEIKKEELNDLENETIEIPKKKKREKKVTYS